jgi:multidrug resistance efflux pump
LQQARDEYDTKVELNRSAPNVVSRREIERRGVLVQTRQTGVQAAQAARQAAKARLNEQLPAQRASTEAVLAERYVVLHVILLRIQALLLPFNTPVLSGDH